MQANSSNNLLQAWPQAASKATETQLAALGKMMDAYMARMQVCNFTAHRTPERFALYNVIDSIQPFIEGQIIIADGAQVADIGTGGGFPGVPLAVLQPMADFFLFDSVGKKLKIINEVCQEIGVTNVKTLNGRIEEYAQQKGREYFDVVTSRAVAHWTILLELALPLLKVGGIFYAYQGERILEELAASEATIRFLGGTLETTTTYDLGEGGKRHLVIIRKGHKTPKDYPRSYGAMLKKPL